MRKERKEGMGRDRKRKKKGRKKRRKTKKEGWLFGRGTV